MENLSRIEISNKLLSELYAKYSHLSDEKLSDSFYSFLVSDENNDLLTSDACFSYKAEAYQLTIYKKDMILDILVEGYGYLKYVQGFCEIPDIEKEILIDLENLSLSISDLIDYFRNSENNEKIKTLLIDYFVYKTQSDEFIESCRKYLCEECFEFYERGCKLIDYVELIDIIAMIHDEITKKYESDDIDEYELFDDLEDEDEDYEEEEEDYEGTLLELEPEECEYVDEEDDPYETMIQMRKLEKEQLDLYSTIIVFLENHFSDKFDMDDFVGYLMSYVYAFLLKEKKQGPMALEDEAMLDILNQSKLSFEQVVETFYASKDYVFNSVDLFVQEYYIQKGDIFSAREKFTGTFERDRFNLLDPYYEGPDFDYNVVYIGSPVAEKFNEMLIDILKENPEDYLGEIWQLLLDPNFDCSLFQKYGFESQYMEYYKILLMRFLVRKYIELVSFNPIVSFSLDELYVYQGLMYADTTNNNIKTLFSMGYYFIIPAYYELLEKGISYEKCIVRKLRNYNLLNRIAKIDSSCVTDSTYRKALQESEFYSILEINGEKTTISYLKHLEKTDYEIVLDYLKELIVSNYYYAKEENLVDSLSMTIFRVIEGETDIENYLQQLLQNDSLLEELLKRYLAKESKTEYSLSYQEKLEKSPKIKQKLYPSDKQGKG